MNMMNKLALGKSEVQSHPESVLDRFEAARIKMKEMRNRIPNHYKN